MPITGFTGSSQLDDSVAAEQISRRVAATAYSKPVADNFLGILGGYDFVSGSLTKSVTKITKFSAGALTTGDDGVATELADTQRNATVSEHGLGVFYGDILDVANATTAQRQRIQMMMLKAYAERVDNQILALATSLTNQVGSVANPGSLDIILAAITLMEDADVDGPFYGIWHARGINHVRQEIGGSSAVNNPIFMRQDVLPRIGPAMANNYAFTVFEVDFFKSSQCPTSGGGKVGYLMPMSAEWNPLVRLIGVPAEGRFAGTPWDMRYEEQRDASGRLDEMWVTGLWTTMLIDLGVGVGLAAVNS